jgi:acyl-coenzyme A synthetase/AMP-(fatty) acid ligase
MPTTTNPQEFDQWVAELRPTWLTAAPAFLQALLERVRAMPAGKLDHALRFVLSTASYLSESVRGELEKHLAIPVVEFYGLCEAGMMTAPSLPPAEARPGTAGRIPPGELAIRGDKQMFLPAASRRAICSTSMACRAAWRTIGCRPATSVASTRTAS